VKRYIYLKAITFSLPVSCFPVYREKRKIINMYYILCRLRKHVSDPTNPPILIFPEGTCINNTSVMQFKKGSFEVGGIIYPVAIKVIFLSVF